MKESTWKFVILGVAILLWTIVMLYNMFCYTPNTFWATSAGTLLQSALVILLTYLLTNKNADDRKKVDALNDIIAHVRDTFVELDTIVEEYLVTTDDEKAQQLYRRFLISKRNLSNYIDILAYYPTTQQFNKCFEKIKELLKEYYELFENEQHIAHEPISVHKRDEFLRIFNLAYHQIILLQTLVFYKKKNKKSIA